MKKKAIKIAASTAVAASAFVAVAPAQQADAATNVNQLITDAQNAGTVLKWAISVEGTADYKTEPWKEYNAAKDALKKAEAAISGLGNSAKLSAQAKLVDPKVQISRAGAYIDAITSGKKILAKNADFEAAVKSGDLNKVEAAYHVVTEEFRKQTILNYRVYGQSTRDEILKEYKLPIEKTVREYASEVTVHMLTKAAAVDVKASKFEEASKKLTDAQALLDAEALTWEETLQKSVNDVEASIPQGVRSIVSDFKNTVTVKFNTKLAAGATILPAGQFTFNNGLIVQSAVVGADGKTVTLTTTTQAANTAFELFYQGKTTGKSFTTPASATDTSIVVTDTTDVALINGGDRRYTVNLTKVDGTPYTGKVTVKLFETDTTNAVNPALVNVSAVNGLATNFTYDAVNGQYEANAVNGSLVFVVKHVAGENAAAVSVTPFVSKYENNKASGKYAGATSFSPLAASKTITKVPVVTTSSNVAGKSFELNGEVYNFDANDGFFLKNSPVTAEVFFKALSKGDVVSFIYNSKAAGASEFRIDTDVTLSATAALKVTNANDVEGNHASAAALGLVGKHVVTHDKDAYRLTGTGQAGQLVEVYRSNGDFVAETVVDNSGSWIINSLSLQDGRNNFVVTQRATDAQRPATGTDVVIFRDFFTSANLFVTDKADSGAGKLSIGDKINVISPVDINNNYLVVANGATLTVKTVNGGTAVISVEADKDNAQQLVVKDITNATTTYDANLNGLFLSAVTGITNQDNLVYNVSESTDVTLNAGAGGGLSPEQVLVQLATDAVVTAENSKTAAAKADAQTAINKLAAGTTRTALQNRLDAIVVGADVVLSSLSASINTNSFGEHAIAVNSATLPTTLTGATALKLTVKGVEYTSKTVSGYFLFTVPTSAATLAEVNAGTVTK